MAPSELGRKPDHYHYLTQITLARIPRVLPIFFLIPLMSMCISSSRSNIIKFESIPAWVSALTCALAIQLARNHTQLSQSSCTLFNTLVFFGDLASFGAQLAFTVIWQIILQGRSEASGILVEWMIAYEAVIHLIFSIQTLHQLLTPIGTIHPILRLSRCEGCRRLPGGNQRQAPDGQETGTILIREDGTAEETTAERYHDAVAPQSGQDYPEQTLLAEEGVDNQSTATARRVSADGAPASTTLWNWMSTSRGYAPVRRSEDTIDTTDLDTKSDIKHEYNTVDQ